MPRGFEGVRQASQEVEARRSTGGPSALWFRLKSGEEAVVRFLEQDDDIHWCWMHEVPVDNRQWGRPVPCIDQEKDGTPCPGCERDLPRKFQGYINLIWDQAPVFKKDENGRLVKDQLNDPVIIERKPQVAVWSSGIRLFEELEEVNANFKGLTSRPFRVKRKGEGLNTKYSISPADIDAGPMEMSDAEKQLAQAKYDLNEYVKPKSYEEWMKELGEGSGQGNVGNNSPPPNPFMRK